VSTIEFRAWLVILPMQKERLALWRMIVTDAAR
jgi:hypothetical protein